MKTFINKATSIRNPGANAGFKTYAELAIECLKVMPMNQNGQAAGLDIDDMSERIDVRKKLKVGGEEIQFEDSEIKKLKECVKLTRWIPSDEDEDVVDFAKYVESL